MATDNLRIPHWRDVYKDQEEQARQSQAEQRAAQAANPPNWAFQMLPPGDPRVLRAKWEHFNPGCAFPEPEGVATTSIDRKGGTL